MTAAQCSETAKPVQIIQLDNGPELNGKESVQPISEVKLQTANAYTDKTAGPKRTASTAADFCAVVTAQEPVRLTTDPTACVKAAGQATAGFNRSALTSLRCWVIGFRPSLFAVSDARLMPKVSKGTAHTFYGKSALAATSPPK